MSLHNKGTVDFSLDVVVVSESDYLPKSPDSKPSEQKGKKSWWKFW